MERLTPEEKELVMIAIDEGAEESDISDPARAKALLETTEGLHLYAQYFNWDNGSHYMLDVIRKPQCDLGTALMIYWMGGARWFCQYENRSEVSPYELDHFDQLNEIEERVAKGFYTSEQIAFDPRRDDEDYDWTADYTEYPVKREIPTFMYGPTRGITISRNS